MSTKKEQDYMKQDAGFLDHQFEVNPPLLAGSHPKEEWKKYQATHRGWTSRELYESGKIDRETFEDDLYNGDADTRYWSVPYE